MLTRKEQQLIRNVVMVLSLTQECFISRTTRPNLTGYVYDSETELPLEGCQVGEVQTDAKGFYQLKERRHTEIFALPGGEAPPVRVEEKVFKKGYKPDTIRGFNRYGGGAHWEMPFTYLRKEK